MSVPRLFYCAVAGFVVATLLSFLFGASGLLNYRRLQEHERRIASGIAALEQRHAHLQRLQHLLRTEPELLRLLARDVGYYRDDELVIGVGPQPEPPAGSASPYAPDFADVGPLVQPRPSLPHEPFNVLALGLFLGLVMFAVLTLKTVLGRPPAAAGAAGSGRLPHAVAGTVEDATPPGGWPEAGEARAAPPPAGARQAPAGPPAAASSGSALRAAAATRRRAAGTPQSVAAAGAESSSRRQRRRPRRRRGEVTVYRL